jgi:hypothetical protein
MENLALGLGCASVIECSLSTRTWVPFPAPEKKVREEKVEEGRKEGRKERRKERKGKEARLCHLSSLGRTHLPDRKL